VYTFFWATLYMFLCSSVSTYKIWNCVRRRVLATAKCFLVPSNKHTLNVDGPI